jgi:hypothetical protein
MLNSFLQKIKSKIWQRNLAIRSLNKWCVINCVHVLYLQYDVRRRTLYFCGILPPNLQTQFNQEINIREIQMEELQNTWQIVSELPMSWKIRSDEKLSQFGKRQRRHNDKMHYGIPASILNQKKKSGGIWIERALVSVFRFW